MLPGHKRSEKSPPSTLDKFLKRKKADDHNDSFVDPEQFQGIVRSQIEQEAPKKCLIGFSNDPKVIEYRKRILSIKNILAAEQNSASSVSSSPRRSFNSQSDGSFYTQNHCRIPKKSKNSVTGLDTDFKSASGRPLVKELLPVSSDNASKVVGNDKASKYLGGRRLATGNSFLAPKSSVKEDTDDLLQSKQTTVSGGSGATNKREGWKAHESLKHFEDNIIDIIEAEIMSVRADIKWTDVAGLESTKKALKEIIVLPFLRPDIFMGIRAPPKGVLLFGPPGTGKTMIGRCVASQCKATFFNIAASSVTSKWVGDGEKLVRALFAIARILQPAVVFIDEIDSLLTSRSEKDHESSRRIKTEFLIHLDGVATTTEERILILGATNRPQELDTAVRRRFAKRLYIGLPCNAARAQMVRSLLSDQKHELSDDDIQQIAKLTEGYSGADVKQLCAEAAMGPVRNIVDSSSLDIASINADDIRPIVLTDFEAAVQFVHPTVDGKDLKSYQEWNKQYGSLVP